MPILYAAIEFATRLPPQSHQMSLLCQMEKKTPWGQMLMTEGELQTGHLSFQTQYLAEVGALLISNRREEGRKLR